MNVHTCDGRVRGRFECRTWAPWKETITGSTTYAHACPAHLHQVISDFRKTLNAASFTVTLTPAPGKGARP